MAESGGQLVARCLQEKRVPVLFTLCGGHISPILVAAKALGIRVADVRNEAAAVFAADASARLTGRPAVAAVTAGPGLTNAVTALQNAMMAQSPVLLIGGAAATILKGRGSLQDIDQVKLIRPVVKRCFTIRRNCDLMPVLEAAFDLTVRGIPGPVFVECPIDLLYAESLVRQWYSSNSAGASRKRPGMRKRIEQIYLNHHLKRMFACDTESHRASPFSPRPAARGPISAVRKAATALGRARKPVMVLGSQSVLAVAQVPALVDALERLAVPVYLAGMARGLLGPTHPLLMRHRRREALASADCILLAGMPSDFRLGYGRSLNRAAVLVGVNRSRRDLRLNRPPAIGILADPCAVLQQIAASVDTDAARWAQWTAELRARDEARSAEIHTMASQPVAPLNPLRLLIEIDRVMADESVIVADGGDFVASAAYILRPRSPLSWLDPGVFGTLGVGAGFALGAHLHRPDAEVWLVYGDGAAGYSLAEFDTFVRHGVPVIAVIGNDGAWAQIARDQVAYLQDNVGTVLKRSDYHTVAAGFGAEGLLLDRAEALPSVLARAKQLAAAGKPVLVNALIGKTDFRKGSLSM
jgi:thiamine pyrophosphate-dependent acetolactate synthase large subunit-like protein